ncbi:MAG: 1,4-alpha-glucan branching protein GlgB [Betaproteobacteria bacterium]|nr:1,4-alpha-glucan branching protein GlgB [Betaproteobacteria bacterium]
MSDPAAQFPFPAAISDHDLHLFNSGRLLQAYRMLGANPLRIDAVDGVRFAVWAPNADRVSVVGDFNAWDARAHALRMLGASGVWARFVPGVAAGAHYKFELRHRDSGTVRLKTDPYARAFELRPGTASRVAAPAGHAWQDAAWMQARRGWDWLHAPLNIYEAHAGSWRRHPDGRVYSYLELAETLVPYLLEMGYTHVELLPVTEHPLDESWGYQSTGFFAPTSRYGSPDGLRAFVDRCHCAGIGVILDWVPGHFPSDDWGLARFDGTALYEHEDPRLGFHADWGTHVFNYGRHEVRGFLLASAYCWLSEFHIDGLRVDAVASMLYLDYSRRAGEWLPNRHGGRENLEAVEFLRELNVMVHGEFPGALTIAEESTAWPMVSRPAYLGGLGFSMKWNMGWMHDTLAYIRRDPVHRRFRHGEITFGQLYAYSENFVLPFSHDEVVHEKGSLLGRMPGDDWQRFANLRLLLAYQLTAPGKKLNFMGNEFGMAGEWSERREIDWASLSDKRHAGVHALARDLNRIYRDTPCLYELDFTQDGFRWVDCHDAERSVVSFLRSARDGSFVAVVLNFTPVPRVAYRLGLPAAGHYHEVLNSDSRYYGGSDSGNHGVIIAAGGEWMGLPAHAALTLPPLACIVIAPMRDT